MADVSFFSIPVFRDKGLKNLTFVVDGPPKTMRLCVYPNEHFIRGASTISNMTVDEPGVF
jgi:hypothetical protein